MASQNTLHHATMTSNYKIYPLREKKNGDFTKMPVIVFLVGNYMTKFSYNTFLEKLTSHNDLIVYVLDTNPDSEWKTLNDFLPLIKDIPDHICQYYDMNHTSNQYYLGGHQIGATIALNSIYPDNYNSNMHSMTMHSIPLPLSGFICFHPVDGRNPSCTNYETKPKFSGKKDTCYVTSHGQVNPYPILMFSSSSKEDEEGGDHIFQAIAGSTNNPKNKYLIMSDSVYSWRDYVDPMTSSSTHILSADADHHAYHVGLRTPDDNERVNHLHHFVIDKILSFIFDEELQSSVIGDIRIRRNSIRGDDLSFHK